jgi:hypothetical protein
MTWQMFRDSFIKRYRPFDHIRRIRNQLIQLRQGNDFSSFVDNFQQLLNQVDSNEFSQQEKLHYFIEGLHPDTRFQVVSKQCSNIEQAILVASEFDSCKHKQVYPVQMAQNNFHNKHKQRSFQNNSNFRKHFNKHDGEKKIFTKPNAAKPQFVKKVENQKSQIKCSRCNLSGHLATNHRVNLKRIQENILTTKV